MPSEEQFLAKQAARCRSRLRHTTGAWREETLAALDLRPLIQRRPWWSLAAAAGGGFLTGAWFGRRGRGSAPQPPASAGPLATASRRVHRLLRSAWNMLAIAGLRANTAGPVPPPSAASPRDDRPDADDGS